MKFYNYINEKSKIKTNIDPFLKEFGDNYYHDRFIYRGVRDTPMRYAHKKTRKDREPRFIRKDLHEYLGEISKQFWGWNIRTEGVFTGGYYTARTFGHPSIFLPIGKYSYVWAEEEIYSEVYSLYDRFDFPVEEDEIKEKIKKLYTKYKTKGLDKYPFKFYESIFRCDTYYLINISYWEEFKTKILGWE